MVATAADAGPGVAFRKGGLSYILYHKQRRGTLLPGEINRLLRDTRGPAGLSVVLWAFPVMPARWRSSPGRPIFT